MQDRSTKGSIVFICLMITLSSIGCVGVGGEESSADLGGKADVWGDGSDPEGTDGDNLQFCLDAGGLNLRNAEVLATLSSLAYYDLSGVRAGLASEGLEFGRADEGQSTQPYVELHDQSGTQVIVARHRTLPLLVLAFRGTEPDSLYDIMADAQIDLEPLAEGDESWGDVHLGFANALEPVWEQLLSSLRAHDDQQLDIWVTGHSLGGALATMMTARLMREGEGLGIHHQLRGLYTFGSPRVGNEAFRTTLMGQASNAGVALHRFRNNRDIVTRMPLRVCVGETATIDWFAEYAHVGTLAHFDEDGGLASGLTSRGLPSMEEEQEEEQFIIDYFENDVRTRGLLDQGILRLIGDHSMNNYLNLVRALDRNQMWMSSFVCQ